MSDCRALQAGTSHNLGQNFAKAFDVTFQTEDNREEYVYATSWGVSTRLIGAIAMVHGDDKGLRLPPRIAPHQVVVVPIGKNAEDVNSVLEYLTGTLEAVKTEGIRCYVDDRDGVTPGFKFNEWEMKGVPVRLEVGSRDMAQNVVTLVRRDSGEKIPVPKDKLGEEIPRLLDEIQKSLYNQAKTFRDEHILTVESYDEFKSIIEETSGFVKCGWDGDPKTEAAIQEETKATIRCIPFEQNVDGLSCVYSGKPAKYQVVLGKAY